jgi:predicted RNA-binding protein YlxR (DUF448 family)
MRAGRSHSAKTRCTTNGTQLFVEGQRRAHGRGAYLHSRLACLALAEKGGFSRSFRRSIPREALAPVREHIAVLASAMNAIESAQSEGSDE